MLTQDRDWTADTGSSGSRQARPLGALILVFTPLMDPRLVETLRDLRQRGFAVLVVDVLNGEPRAGRGRGARLAQRIWRMEQQDPVLPARTGHPCGALGRRSRALDLSLAPLTRRATDVAMTSVTVGPPPEFQAAWRIWCGAAVPSGSRPRPVLCSARPAAGGVAAWSAGQAGSVLTVLAACCVAGVSASWPRPPW